MAGVSSVLFEVRGYKYVPSRGCERIRNHNLREANEKPEAVYVEEEKV